MPTAPTRAEVELPLGADVEELHAERGSGGEAGEQRSASPRSSVAESAPFAVNAGLERVVRYVSHGCARSREDDRHHRERDDERADRDGDRQPARLRRAAARASLAAPAGHQLARSPRPSRPRHRARRRSAPSYMTSDPVGERADLVEVLADQQHRDARSPRPRGGTRAPSRSRRRRARASAAATTSTRGSPANSRPRTSFWRFPPERLRTGVVRARASSRRSA